MKHVENTSLELARAEATLILDKLIQDNNVIRTPYRQECSELYIGKKPDGGYLRGVFYKHTNGLYYRIIVGSVNYPLTISAHRELDVEMVCVYKRELSWA